MHQDREWGHRPARKLPTHNREGVYVCLHVCMYAHVCMHTVHCVYICACVLCVLCITCVYHVCLCTGEYMCVRAHVCKMQNTAELISNQAFGMNATGRESTSLRLGFCLPH